MSKSVTIARNAASFAAKLQAAVDVHHVPDVYLDGFKPSNIFASPAEEWFFELMFDLPWYDARPEVKFLLDNYKPLLLSINDLTKGTFDAPAHLQKYLDEYNEINGL